MFRQGQSFAHRCCRSSAAVALWHFGQGDVGRVGAMEISPLSGSTVTLSAKNDEIIEKTLSSKKSKYYH